MYETARFAAANAEVFRKNNLLLSFAFNSILETSFPQIENNEFY